MLVEYTLSEICSRFLIIICFGIGMKQYMFFFKIFETIIRRFDNFRNK